MLNNETLRQYFSNGIGYDRFFDEISRKNYTSQPNYPPYNILKIDDFQYLIELAVAGFSKDDLIVECANDILTVAGSKDENTVEHEYIHKGIGARLFCRKFTISPDVVIKNVALENGLLKVLLERIVPEHKKPKKLTIGDKLEIESRTVTDDQLLFENDDMEVLQNAPNFNINPPRTSEVG